MKAKVVVEPEGKFGLEIQNDNGTTSTFHGFAGTEQALAKAEELRVPVGEQEGEVASDG